MEHAEQQLFLMEFLVDRVNIPSVRAMHDEILPVTTCVSFQVLSLPPITICQEATSDGCMCIGGDVQLFKKGKSCLFALPSVVVEKPLHSFPVAMSVYKRLPPGVLPDVMLIGSRQIEAKDILNAVLNRNIFEGGSPARTMKDTFKITTATGQNVGEVTVFVRVTCFGKKIVTQFQIPHNKKPYLFKGAHFSSPVYQCKKLPSGMVPVPPPKCCCEQRTNGVDGSGEAGPRTCCPTPAASKPTTFRSPAKYKPPDHGPRPCCPSLRSPSVACPPRSQSSPGHGANVSSSPQCSPGCSPAASPALLYLQSGARVRKCGCAVKEEKGCSCGEGR